MKNMDKGLSAKLGADKSAENNPKSICPKVWDFDEKKSSLSVRSLCSEIQL